SLRPSPGATRRRSGSADSLDAGVADATRGQALVDPLVEPAHEAVLLGILELAIPRVVFADVRARERRHPVLRGFALIVEVAVEPAGERRVVAARGAQHELRADRLAAPAVVVRVVES